MERPLITPARKIAYALAAGCTIVLRAAEETPTAAVELVQAFDEVGTPPGVLNLVFRSAAEVGARLMGSALTKGATFTGSTAVGKQLLALAAPTVRDHDEAGRVRAGVRVPRRRRRRRRRLGGDRLDA